MIALCESVMRLATYNPVLQRVPRVSRIFLGNYARKSRVRGRKERSRVKKGSLYVRLGDAHVEALTIDLSPFGE